MRNSRGFAAYLMGMRRSLLVGAAVVSSGAAIMLFVVGSVPALAGSSSHSVRSAHIVLSDVPNLTGYWVNEADRSSPAWNLTTSDCLRVLIATWSGSGSHSNLRGHFDGSLTQANGRYVYEGNFDVSEPPSPTVTGTAAFAIDNPNKMELYFNKPPEGAPTYTFIRQGGAAPPFPCPEQTVPQPAPGASESVQAPDALPANANSESVTVSSSGGSVPPGDNIAAPGDVSTVGHTFGNFVAWCWLTLDFSGSGIDPSPQLQFAVCVELLKKLTAASTTAAADTSAAQPIAALATSGGVGCKEKAIPIDLQVRHGNVVKASRDRHAKLKASSVRYSCRASGGVGTITVKTPRGLRKALGKKLHLAVIRAKSAPRTTGTVKLMFSW